MSRVLALADRLASALVDPARRERTAVVVLLSYVALWAIYGAIAKSSQDLHFDMGEVIAWTRELAWGYPKHPPLSAWVAKLWFGVFPLADWSYYLLAVSWAALGLWIAWRLSADYLDADKRVAGLALLTLVPFFNFHALKFNANSVLIPVWAATTWWFIRSFETRSFVWAALAGLGAAAAMFGKYWSIVLLIALGIGALSDPRRREYFRSPAPWVTVAMGAIAIAPHVYWLLWLSDFVPFEYALAHHKATLWQATVSAFKFLGGVAAFIVVPLLFFLTATRLDRAAVYDTFWPPPGRRRTALVIFAVPVLLPFVIGIVLKSSVNALWTISAMTLLPVVLLSSPLVKVSRRHVAGLCALAIAVPVVMVVASPVIAYAIYRGGLSNYATHYRLIAQAVERAWRDNTGAPLKIVSSYTNVLNGMMPYLPRQVTSYDVLNPRHTPWIDEARIARDGVAVVCPIHEQHCMTALGRFMTGRAPEKSADVEIQSRYLGAADRPVRYRIVVFPPRSPESQYR